MAYDNKNQPPEKLCLGLAEYGKIQALDNNHPEALRHYREALKLALDTQANDLYFHYVTQCIMESLELSGALQELCAYCEKLETRYAEICELPEENRLHRASNLERHGLAELQLENPETASHLLNLALGLVSDHELPVARKVSHWLDRRFQVNLTQLRKLQKEHNYFMVRREKLQPDIAIALPDFQAPGL